MTKTKLSQTLIRNLLPPNLQQLSERPSSPTLTPQSVIITKPNTVKQLSFIMPTSDNNGTYSVVMKYASKAELTKIQKLIPKAIVKTFPDGELIQLISVQNEATALSIVKELQTQKISAWVRGKK